MGDIAAGKSTFANILSKRYNTNVFFKDSIKEVLGDTIGFPIEKKIKNYLMQQWSLCFLFYQSS